MKKHFTILVALLMIIGLFAACTGGEDAATPPAVDNNAAGAAASPGNEAAGSSGDRFVVGYTNIADTDRWCKYTTDCFAALVAEHSNIELILTDANLDVSKQLDQVDNFILQEVDLIVIVPVDYAGVVPAIKKANDAGIPVICSMIAAEEGDYTYVGSSHHDAGRMQGAYMAENLPENARVLYLAGTPGLAHSSARWEGFVEACLDARGDLEVLDNQTANYLRAEGMSLTEDWITRFDAFDAIVAANDEMILGAVEALKGANRLEGVLTAGVDGSYDACVAIMNGELTLSVFQNGDAIAAKTCEIMLEILSGNTVDSENIIPFENVTIDNVDSYYQYYLDQGYGE